MATTEEFLITLGLDEASVRQVIDQINNLKNQADTTVQVGVETNADAVAAQVAGATAQIGYESEQAFATFEDGIRDVEQGLNELRGTIIAVSAAAGAIAAIGFGQAAEESRNLARANVILGQTNQELAVTQQQLRDVADATGLTYVQVSSALFDVASAGFQGAEAVDAIRAAANAAVPAGIQVSDAFNAIATAQKNFGISSEEAGDKLVRISDLTRGTLGDVANAVGLIGPVAAQAGISLDELGAAFATVTATGQTGEVAATLLFNAIISFIAPAKEAEEILKQIGITTGDAAFQSQTLAQKIDILRVAAATGQVEIGKVFNQRALRGVGALIQQAEFFGDALNKVADSSGRTARGVADFFKSAGPQLDLLKTSFLNLATAIGTDLLNSLTPLIVGITAFVNENRGLLTILTKAGLVLGGLGAAWLTYRVVVGQVNAAIKVFNGLAGALNAVLTFESGSLLVNAAAWKAKLLSQENAQASGIIGFLRNVIAALSTETGVVVANTLAWAKRVAIGIVKSIVAGLKMIDITLQLIGQLVLEIAALKSATIARIAYNHSTVDSTGLVRKFADTIGSTVSQLSIATTAAGVLAAAFVGWQLGKWINKFFDLEGAISRVTKGTGSLGDQIKAAFVGLLPVVGTVIAYNKRAATEATRAANTMTEQQRKVLEANDAVKTYNRLIQEGANHGRAYAIALGNTRTELEFLEQLYQRGKASDEQLQRRTALQTQLSRELANQNAERREALQIEARLNASVESLRKNQEAYNKVVAETQERYEKFKFGGLRDALQSVRQFETEFNQVLQNFSDLSTELGVVQSQLGRTDLSAAELQKFQGDTDRIVNDIINTYKTLSQNIEVTTQDIIQTTNNFINELRAASEEEKRLYREAKEEIIRLLQEQTQQIKTELDKQLAERERAVQRVESFATRLEDAQRQREDPALAEAVRLERDFNAAIKDGIASVEQQARVLQLLREELERLSAPTREEENALKGLQEAQAKLREVDQGEGNQEERTRLTEREKELQERISELQDARSKREQEAQRILDEATANAAKAQEEFVTRDEQILENRTKLAELEHNIELTKQAILEKEKEITAETNKQIANAKAWAQTLIDILNTAGNIVEKVSQAAEAQGAGVATPEQEAASQQVREKFTKGIQEAEEAAEEGLVGEDQIRQSLDSVKQQADEVTSFINAIKDEFLGVNEEIARQAAELQPAATSVVDAFTDLGAKFEPTQTAVQRMLESTEQFAPQVESFAEATSSALQSQQQRLDQTTNRLSLLEDSVRAIANSGGGANGLSN